MAAGDASGFAFPKEHDFPPFYTLQPNTQTASVQVEMWSRLVLAYCAEHSRFWLDAAGSWERSSPLFCNRRIDRALAPATIRVILAHLVEHRHAIYAPPLPKGVKPPTLGVVQADRTTRAQSATAAATPALSTPTETACNRVLLLWKTPEAWGDQLYQWVCNTGQNKSVMTMHELATSHFCAQTGMPPLLLRLALQTQIQKGRTQVFAVTSERWSSMLPTTDLLAQATDESMGELGVKFV